MVVNNSPKIEFLLDQTHPEANLYEGVLTIEISRHREVQALPTCLITSFKRHIYDFLKFYCV